MEGMTRAQTTPYKNIPLPDTFGPRNIDVPLSTLAVSGRYMWEGWSATRRARQAIHGRGAAPRTSSGRAGWVAGGHCNAEPRRGCCCRGGRTMRVRRGPSPGRRDARAPRSPWLGVQGPGVVGVRLPVGGDGAGMGAAAGRRGINADAAGWRPCREAARGKRDFADLNPSRPVGGGGRPGLGERPQPPEAPSQRRGG